MDRQYFAGSASPFAWQAGRIQSHCAGLEPVVVVYVTYVSFISFFDTASIIISIQKTRVHAGLQAGSVSLTRAMSLNSLGRLAQAYRPVPLLDN